MKPKRLKSWGLADRTMGNVVDLLSFRARHQSARVTVGSLWYISDRAAHSALLASLQFLRIRILTTANQFEMHLETQIPDLVVIDADIDWANALDVAEMLYEKWEIGILLLSPTRKRNHSHYVRKAYAAGVQDILFTPFAREDLFQAVHVLSQLQRQLSNRN